MKRWLSHLVITAYLSALGMGLFCHALEFQTGIHPGMYFFVWDMFCGWAAHEIRYHVIGEGESGTYYELAPGPWGAFTPYGNLERQHHDALGNHFHRMASNTLRHTDHEPITRIFVVEEAWSKKYNLPDHIWAQRFEEPKDPHHYYWVWAIYNSEGLLLSVSPTWITHQYHAVLLDNPRLQAEFQKSRPFLAINPQHRLDADTSGTGLETATFSRLGAALAN